MCLRIELNRNYAMDDPFRLTKADRFVSFLGPLWVDPTDLQQKKHRARLAFLFIPLVTMFTVSFVLVIDVSFILNNPYTTSDDLFPSATDVNNYILLILLGVGAGLVLYSCIKTALFANDPVSSCSSTINGFYRLGVQGSNSIIFLFMDSYF